MSALAGVARPTSDELEVRRSRVLTLRLRRMTETAIAAIVDVSRQTVSDDLAWIRANWRERYGPLASVDPAEIVGETLAFYEDAEQQALREHARLGEQGGDPVHVARQRMACLRLALDARRMQVDLLLDLGLLDPSRATSAARLPRAAEIREALRLVREEERALVSEAERDPPKRVWPVRMDKHGESLEVGSLTLSSLPGPLRAP